ncbi:WYL domain-containing protein [Nocardioides humi]|uniref:WYL domain-containing protein n=1 Tax=Nocardioides humi TaxID=449461 RepID=A0ABN2A4Z5_9ACTN
MRADRLLRLLALLQRHRRLTAARLAAELEVSERTVLRDMEALSAAGVPVYTEQGRGGGCVLLEDFTTRAAGLTPVEAQALFAWSARESVAELGLSGPLASGLAKIAASAPTTAVERAEAMGTVVHSDRRRWFSPADDVPLLPVLREATTQRRRLRARYTSAGAAAPATRTLHPIGLVDHSGRWYLVAEHRRQVRTYRVSRFAAATVLPTPVDLADPRPVAEIWADLRGGFEQESAQVTAVVTARRAAAPLLRRLLRMGLAPGTDIEVVGDPAPDGTETWRLRTTKPDVLTAMAVVYTPDLTLLEPVALREGLRRQAERALAHYPPDSGVRR